MLWNKLTENVDSKICVLLLRLLKTCLLNYVSIHLQLIFPLAKNMDSEIWFIYYFNFKAGQFQCKSLGSLQFKKIKKKTTHIKKKEYSWLENRIKTKDFNYHLNWRPGSHPAKFNLTRTALKFLWASHLIIFQE